MFPDILELIKFVEDTQQSDQYLYRGQLERGRHHEWKVDDKLYQVEAIYPSDFRFHYKHHEPSEELSRKISAARSFNRERRDQFAVFLLGFLNDTRIQNSWADAELNNLSDELTKLPLDTHFFRMAWSLAQHYLLTTALVDFTFSIRVAAWFATNPWEPNGRKPQEGAIGVIYRLNKLRMEDLLADETAQMRAWAQKAGLTPAPELFLVDIRQIPHTFAKRPSAQHGASVYGFDQPLLIVRAFASGAVEALEFKHREGMDVGFARAQLIPEVDPFLSLKEQFLAIRERIKPETINGQDLDVLERVNTILHIPLESGRLRERIEFTDRYIASLFDDLQSFGQIQYKYLMAVIDKDTGALICVIAVERSQMMNAVDLPPETLKALGWGTEVLGLWDGRGRSVIDIGMWQTFQEFRARALTETEKAIQSAIKNWP